MTTIANLQHKTLPSDKVLELLIYFKRFRGITNRELAEKLHYQETYISQVLNGHKEGGEKLLHALETFFVLDNLQQIAQIERKKMDLEREKLVLQGLTVEKFYAERTLRSATRPGQVVRTSGPDAVRLNDATASSSA